MTDREQTRRDAEKLRGNIEAGLRLLTKPRSGLSARTAEVCMEDLGALTAMLEQARDEWKRRAESLAIAIEQRAREMGALIETLNRGNLDGETPEIRAWCGAVIANLEQA